MKKTKANSNFSLTLPTKAENAATKIWFYLAIFAITVAGLFSLPPVVLRKSQFKDVENIEHIFSVALVIHVNLSVLVWMLAISSMLWSLSNQKKFALYNIAAPYIAFFGAILMAISPFVGGGDAFKNNYIPMFQNHAFIFGLGFFGSGVLLQVVLRLLNFNFMRNPKGVEFSKEFGLYSAALITLIAFGCFLLSGIEIRKLPYAQNALDYYEMLFWAGGHVLQFTYTQILIVAWLYLANEGVKLPVHQRNLNMIFLIGLFAVIFTPVLYGIYEVDDADFINFFTKKMQMMGGIGPFFAGIIVVLSLFVTRPSKRRMPEIYLLVFSLILFALGGFLGLMISGTNVTIPAHYHGSIVGITLALMALVHNFLPKLGFAEIKGKLANIQPFIYGIGQIMHITGLAWMGGYGALRKAPGSSASVETIGGKILFFSGGGFAIIGGFLFVIIVYISLFKKKRG